MESCNKAHRKQVLEPLARSLHLFGMIWDVVAQFGLEHRLSRHAMVAEVDLHLQARKGEDVAFVADVNSL